MSFIPRPHEIYKHFKGNLYQIVAIAEHSETGEQLVIYQALYGEFKIYARPLAMFTSKVDRDKYPDVKQEYRFELQEVGAMSREAGAMRKETDTTTLAGGAISQEAHTVSQGNSIRASEEVTDEQTVDADCEVQLDPMVLEFLDADSYEQRLNILAGLRHRITNEMITTMAIACDIEVAEGDTEERYASLKNCLLTLERYECNRLR